MVEIKEKMVEYYTFGRETELYKLLSELDEEGREDYLDGFDALDEEVDVKVELFIKEFIELVYGNKERFVGKVVEITDENVELCVTEL